MSYPLNRKPIPMGRREVIVRLCRLGIRGMAAAGLWQFWPGGSALAAPDPAGFIAPMDAAAPADLETATFGLG